MTVHDSKPVDAWRRPLLSRVLVVVLALMMLGLFTPPRFAAGQEVPVVTAVEVKGLKRIEEGALRSHLSQKIKDPLSQEKTTEDIKSIYKMGYFDDVRVDIEPFEGGIKVIYVVKEKPTIIGVDFQGNKEYDDAKMRELVTLAPGAIADITLVNDNALKIKAFYEDEGYYLAQIVPVIRKVTEGEVSVTYQIDEGPEVKIKEIVIEGNKAISAKKIKGVMKTEERGWLSWITKSGFYKKEVMKGDVERIRDLYYNNGYIKSTIGEPKIDVAADKKSMRIAIPISEGEQFKVSDIKVAGYKVYSEPELLKTIKLAKGAVFSKETLQKDIAALTDLYSNTGYALASISPDLVADETKQEVEVVYRINEGAKYRVGRIDVIGNTKTKDKVIRREVRLDEGETFNSSAVKRSYERLNNLNYFETVEMNPKPRPEEKIVDLDVKVKEKSTGSLSIGGGYSSADGIVGMVDLSQGNLFGTGQFAKIRAELGTKASYFEINYRDPWFLDRPLGLSVSVYNSIRQYGDYNRRAIGFDVSLSQSFWEYWSVQVGYGLERALVYDLNPLSSIYVKEQQGTNVISKIYGAVVRDTRDNYLDPSRGSRNAVYLTFAGLGGTTAYFKGLVDSGWFFPLFSGTTYYVRGRVGWSTGLFGNQIPIYEKFYVGGINTVRGFGYGYAGPLDPDTLQPIGGIKELVINNEFIFPILPQYKLKGYIFFDTGRGYAQTETFGSSPFFSVGPGIRWVSPVGPINIVWGYILNPPTGMSKSKIDFTFGTFF